MDLVYQKVPAALEEQCFFVVFEPAMGETMKRFKERWGEDYHRNELSDIRSMVGCNTWSVNQRSNLDPAMPAMCPLRVGLIEKDGVTRVLFPRATLYAQGSPALPIFQRIEDAIIDAIEKSVP